ncbi:MAG: class D sortase [Minwuia sp.]|uniref:class D sortase n=1 Tax=Minwuia sp. TaxID=2493630 RepID=UPI003A843ECF
MIRRRKRVRWPLRAALLAAAIVGALIAGNGLFMAVKASFGQVLLERAYDSGGEPWPGADLKALARLEIPKLGEAVIVLDSATGKAMAWGPGHVRGTVLPGEPGLSAVGGHRDSHMAFLGKLAPGDEVILERPGSPSRAFAVTHAEVVDGRTWRYPAASGGVPRLALTTCWPLGAETPGPLRLIVYADAFPD